MRALITLPLQGNETHIAPGADLTHPAALLDLAANHVIAERVGRHVRDGLRAEVIAQSSNPFDGFGLAVSA